MKQPTRELSPKYVDSTGSSTLKKKKNKKKQNNEQKIQINISLKKTHRWPKST